MPREDEEESIPSNAREDAEASRENPEEGEPERSEQEEAPEARDESAHEPAAEEDRDRREDGPRSLI